MKKTHAFQPGFRISKTDVVTILLAFALAGWAASAGLWPLGVLLLYVKAHFFLFCNVFRINRGPELIWAVVFVGMYYLGHLRGFPSPSIFLGAGSGLAALLIAWQTRRPDYHGILWQRWNPGLPAWWENYVKGSSEHGDPPVAR